jgi:hypothetical protein
MALVLLRQTQRRHWGFVRAWGWVWVGISLALVALDIAVSNFMRRCSKARTPEHITRLPGEIIGLGELMMSMIGAVISSAVLAGQVGDLLAGHVGFQIGELLGGLFLGLPLAVITGVITNNGFKDRRALAWKAFSVSHCIGIIVFLAVANGGVLWLLLGL